MISTTTIAALRTYSIARNPDLLASASGAGEVRSIFYAARL